MTQLPTIQTKTCRTCGEGMSRTDLKKPFVCRNGCSQVTAQVGDGVELSLTEGRDARNREIHSPIAE